MKNYKFFYHYRKQEDKMTVHFRGKCYSVKDVVCYVPTKTKWNSKRQPHLILEGYTSDVVIIKDVAYIQEAWLSWGTNKN